MTKFYEGVDSLSNFQSQEELENYRAMLLTKTAPQSEFIAQAVGSSPFSVIELCSGNGRLLVDLALRRRLTTGVGVELAESRVEFANRWIADSGLFNVAVQQGDILDTLPPGSFDVAVCITGALQYFSSLDMLDILDSMKTKAGMSVLEFYTIPVERIAMLAVNNGVLRTWDALPPEDPFAYYMDNYTYNSSNNTMRHEKVFIHRSGRIDEGRVETLYYHTPNEITCMMNSVGFRKVDIQYSWTGTEKSDKLVVIGR